MKLNRFWLLLAGCLSLAAPADAQKLFEESNDALPKGAEKSAWELCIRTRASGVRRSPGQVARVAAPVPAPGRRSCSVEATLRPLSRAEVEEGGEGEAGEVVGP